MLRLVKVVGVGRTARKTDVDRGILAAVALFVLVGVSWPVRTEKSVDYVRKTLSQIVDLTDKLSQFDGEYWRPEFRGTGRAIKELKAALWRRAKENEEVADALAREYDELLRALRWKSTLSFWYNRGPCHQEERFRFSARQPNRASSRLHCRSPMLWNELPIGNT